MEDLKRKPSNISSETTNQQDEMESRTFPSWSIAISNIMEHNGELVMFIAISAIVEDDMKKKEPRPTNKSSLKRRSNSMEFSAVDII